MKTLFRILIRQSDKLGVDACVGVYRRAAAASKCARTWAAHGHQVHVEFRRPLQRNPT